MYLHVPISIRFFRFRESCMIHGRLKYFEKYKEHNRSPVPGILWSFACKNQPYLRFFLRDTLFAPAKLSGTRTHLFERARM